ncbi:MAG TPA: hypothetical protein VNI55_06600 [Gaiellaceae bacterium]|nr:hypothetical protein [Gaiellaceae bacterium]
MRRRQVGHNLGANGDADLRASGNSGKQALAVASWEAAGGDPLAALSLALDELARRAG